MSPAFNKIINEYFNIVDNQTREHVLSLNEAEQDKLLSKLTTKLYEHITSRVTDIDFGSIPKTKGDITKLDNYENLVDCINTIESLLTQYKQKLDPITTIKEALENIKAMKNQFEMGFKLNDEFICMIYSTVSLAIVSSTSFLISTCIEYIKSPNNELFEISLDKVSLSKTKDNLLFDNLKRFNITCKKGDMAKILDYSVQKGSKHLLGIGDAFVVMNAGLIIIIIFNIIPMIRELIYFFYYSRVRLSDYFDIQADLLQMNIYNLERNSDMDPDTRKTIIEKQSKIVNIFRNISNKINISNKQSENKTKSDISKDNLKFNVDKHTGELDMEKTASTLF